MKRAVLYKRDIKYAAVAGLASSVAAVVLDATGLFDYAPWEILASAPCGALCFVLCLLLVESAGRS